MKAFSTGHRLFLLSAAFLLTSQVSAQECGQCAAITSLNNCRGSCTIENGTCKDGPTCLGGFVAPALAQSKSYQYACYEHGQRPVRVFCEGITDPQCVDEEQDPALDTDSTDDEPLVFTDPDLAGYGKRRDAYFDTAAACGYQLDSFPCNFCLGTIPMPGTAGFDESHLLDVAECEDSPECTIVEDTDEGVYRCMPDPDECPACSECAAYSTGNEKDCPTYLGCKFESEQCVRDSKSDRCPVYFACCTAEIRTKTDEHVEFKPTFRKFPFTPKDANGSFLQAQLEPNIETLDTALRVCPYGDVIEVRDDPFWTDASFNPSNINESGLAQLDPSKTPAYRQKPVPGQTKEEPTAYKKFWDGHCVKKQPLFVGFDPEPPNQPPKGDRNLLHYTCESRILVDPLEIRKIKGGISVDPSTCGLQFSDQEPKPNTIAMSLKFFHTPQIQSAAYGACVAGLGATSSVCAAIKEAVSCRDRCADAQYEMITVEVGRDGALQCAYRPISLSVRKLEREEEVSFYPNFTICQKFNPGAKIENPDVQEEADAPVNPEPAA